eukprot:TRINITY_DN1258_c0_g2_i2.p1 TRINITY_DN1258_c0_g2~~TRINITY_DN1258_c0_g2_i2.p1  ORF type:complete len:301 (+),score=65.19 TRINITY_DN1258_c0_g2_i2:101-1003(+)
MQRGLVGSEMCIRDRVSTQSTWEIYYCGKMSMIRLIVGPIITGGILLLLWILKYLSGMWSLQIFGVLLAIYIFVQIIRYGIIFPSAILQEVEWPAMTVYYQEYEGEYKAARKNMLKPFKDSDKNMLKSIPSVSYFEFFPEITNKNYKASSGHCAVGFGLLGEAVTDIGIKNVLESLRFKKKQIEPCTAVTMTMRKVDEYSKSIALYKLSDALWSSLENKKENSGVFFVWEEKKTVTCGVFIGERKNQFLVHGIVGIPNTESNICLLYTSDAADDTPCVDLGGRRIIKKKKKEELMQTDTI